MKVILTKEVENLGKKYELVQVSNGYARNFLLPKELALRATPSNIKQLKEHQKIALLKDKKSKTRALRIAEKLEGVRIIAEREVGEEGKVFGSVTSQDITEEIKRKFNLEIDHRKISLDEPLRVIGIRKISIKLHPEVEIPLQVELKKKTTAEGFPEEKSKS